MRVAFAGEHGSFGEDAVVAFFRDATPIAMGGFRDVVELVAGSPVSRSGSDTPEAGVLPIENLVNGTVREVYDLLLEHPVAITGEVIVPVRLCLAALPGERIESIERVYSHGQALAQAERFLRSRPWALLATYNTAGSGRMIAERREHHAAAVLSPRGAALFGLTVLVPEIQDVPDNRTRFLVVAPEGTPPPPDALAAGPPMRTTLVLGVPNEAGALHRCLGVLADAGVNVSKLESRPSRTTAWEYIFWLDLDGDARSEPVLSALRDVERVASFTRVMGSYRRAPDP